MSRGMNLPLFAAAALVVIAGGSGHAAAATANWNGLQSTDWYDPTNWSTAAVPTAADDVTIEFNSPNGTVISGGNANAQALYVAKFAGHTGTLDIDNAAIVNAAQVILGGSLTSSGTLKVDGNHTALNISGGLAVGSTGSGSLTVSGGATVQATSADFSGSAGSAGTGLVTGAGSAINISGELDIANGAAATLSITQGGHVSNNNVFVAVGFVDGTVNVSGTGSQWAINGTATFGESGNAIVNVTAGGVVTTSGNAILGFLPNGQGNVTVDGAHSVWNVTQTLIVGNQGNGNVAIKNGGSVSDIQGWIAAFGGSTASVTVDGAHSSWSTGVNGIRIGFVGNGSLTISNGGDVSSLGLVRVASDAGSHGALNIGADKFSAAAAPGTLTADNLQFGSGTGEINFNHTGGCYDFTTKISGFGTIDQLAGCTLLHVDDSAFTGATNVTGGSLYAQSPGSLSHSVVTVSGGLLGGNGTVGGIIVNGGGTVQPGGDGLIGTLSVNGNVAFNVGSTFEVKTDAAGHSDKIAASGTATLSGGTVSALASGPLPAAMQYTILTANGGVNGQFDSVVTNYAFLQAVLGYDADDVFLTLSPNGVGFADVGVTPNQKASAAAAQALGPGSPIYNAILGLSAPDADHAFDALSGEIHASVKGVLLEDSRFPRDAALDRMRSAFGGVASGDGRAYRYQDGNPVLTSGNDPGAAFWGRGFGSWGSFDGDGNAATIDRTIGGLLLGADARVFDNARLGIMGGFSRSSYDVDARQSSASSDDYHLGIYGGTTWADVALRAGAAYSWHNIKTDREIDFGGFGDSPKATYDARTAQVFAELGYRINLGNMSAVALEPFANFAYANLSTDAFSERGGDTALTAKGDHDDVSFMTLGVRGRTLIDLAPVGSVTARGTIGWRDAFGDLTPDATLAFSSGGSFAIAGTPITKSAAMLEAGLVYAIMPCASLDVSYGDQIGSHIFDQTLQANFDAHF